MLTLEVLTETLGICKLAPTAAIPAWASKGAFFSITKTVEELSVVCSETNIPDGVLCEKGWRALKLQGPFAFDLVGIVAAVSAAVADAGIGIFVISTYDTDYILVKAENFEPAIQALQQAGHKIIR